MNKIYCAAENILVSEKGFRILFRPIIIRIKTIRSILMNMKSVAKGAAAGAIDGITYYALSSATPMKKYSIKRNAGKTLKAAGSLIDDIKSVLM